MVLVSRCCGGEWIGRTCTSSNGRAAGRKGRLGVLPAVCGLVLAVSVAPARAADAPQPPVLPTVPPVAVNVSVSVPGVSVSVQVGTVAVSVSTAPVEVSVSVPSPINVTSTEPAAAAPPPTTQNDGSSDCCKGEAKDVAPPAAAAVETSPPARASPRRQRARPTIRAAASPRTIAPPADPPARLLAARNTPVRSERPATRRKPAPGCCAKAHAAVADPQARVAARPRVELPPDRYQLAGLAAVPVVAEPARDNRLFLQLGVLAAFLYLVCLAAWFAATRPKQRRA